MIELGCGSVKVLVDDAVGARLASLRVEGVERLVTGGSVSGAGGDGLGWGAYPMVPWAGRVRRGRFAWAGETVDLPPRMPPHAIHGTVAERPWAVVAATATEAVLNCDLGPDWPWPGSVVHHVAVDHAGVMCRLTVSASGDAFPAQVGWHPWFSDEGQPPTVGFAAALMYQRDADYLPDGRLVPPGAHPWDDCFVGVRQPVTVTYRDGVRLAVTSDCDHWVVYEPAHATCVEPQSGPPDGFVLAPEVVTPQRPLARWMRLEVEQTSGTT